MPVGGATFLGIGSMIGAGIFALLGEKAAVAGAAVWISFLIGGVVAMLLGYACVVGAKFVARAQPLIVIDFLCVFAVFIVVTIFDINPDLLAFRRVPVVLEDPGECRSGLLRIPGVQCDHLRGRRPERPGTRPAASHVRRARRHIDVLRADRARRIRHAHRRVVANLVDLSAIASVGSAVALAFVVTTSCSASSSSTPGVPRADLHGDRRILVAAVALDCGRARERCGSTPTGLGAAPRN
jgi:hypothetical protein